MRPDGFCAAGRFESVSIVLPVINEVESLQQTVDIIRRTCRADDIAEYLIVVCERTTARARAKCESIRAELGGQCRIHEQKLPFIGGAMREAFTLVRGSHVVMMSTDLETDPNLIRQFIALSKEDPGAIITASRWLPQGRFEGYSRIKLLANYTFQKMLGLLYCTRLGDLTYAYRIFPAALVKGIQWEELRHPFFLETVIKPLRLGVPVREIPAVWRARPEGESQNTFFRNFAYLKIALRVRFIRPETFWGKSAHGS